MKDHLRELYGNIDIYLFDQLLKGTYNNCGRVLDAGCGNGRNIIYFLKNNYDVHAVDPDPDAVRSVKDISKLLAPDLPDANFKIATAESLPYPDEYFDLVISSAVLHFANSPAHFDEMLREMWRTIKPGGYLFARLASDIGIESLIQPVGNGRYILPDGSERYLVGQQELLDYTKNLGAALHEPIKTTNVQNLRCMTTWCLRKD